VQIFWKRNEDWDPPLFASPDLKTYSQGVSQWTASAAERVAQLRTTLGKAEDIRKTSDRQSTLLRQVTNLVNETEQKITKTAEELNQQGQIIDSFNADFAAVQVKLQAFDERRGLNFSNFKFCTSYDICCYVLIGFSVAGIFLAIEIGIEKWQQTLGLPEIPFAI